MTRAVEPWPEKSVRCRTARPVKMIRQLEPHVLADVLGVALPVPAAGRPDQRYVPLDKRIPGLLVPLCCASRQLDDHRLIARSGRREGRCGWRDRAVGAGWKICHRGRWPPRVGRCRAAGCLSGHDLVLPPARNGPGMSGHMLVSSWPDALMLTTRARPQDEAQDQVQRCACLPARLSSADGNSRSGSRRSSRR
jgi:hypothetical protein